MRRPAIIKGFKNSQKFRFILTAHGGEQVGMTMTIQQMSDQFATTDARASIWTALAKLASDRRIALVRDKPLPTGLVVGAHGFRQVQVDLY